MPRSQPEASSTQPGLALQASRRLDEGKPRVLYLIDHLSRGGAAQVVVNTALSLHKGKYSPVVCTTRPAPDSLLNKALEEAGIPLIELNRTSRVDLASWRELWRVLPTVSILHSHESGSNVWARIWGPIFRVPIIITHDHTAANEKPRMSHFADRLLSRLSDRIVAVSEFDRTLLIEHEHLPPAKVITIYNGIEPDRFSLPLDKPEARSRAGLPDAGLLIAVIARLADQKNHAALFEALKLLPGDLQAITQCLVIGSGPLETSLKELSHQQGLDDMVTFLGERSDIPVVLNAIDLFVLPSRWECLPMVLLEALAAGTPIVATSVGGVPEVMEQLDWPLVDQSDPPALAAAITQVARMSSSERAEAAESGRRLVEKKFTREVSAARVEALYDSLRG